MFYSQNAFMKKDRQITCLKPQKKIDFKVLSINCCC